MQETKEEEQLRLLQRMVPNATLDTLKVFHECMQTDAIYKSALPYGIVTSIITHMFIPKKFGYTRYFISGTTGLLMYIFSKLTYVPVCCQKAVKLTNVEAPLYEQRKQVFYGSDKQDTENKNLPPTDHWAEDQDVNWSNFDTDFDSTSHEFNDTYDNIQEEVIHETPKTQKPRVTYDDLWKEHRQQTNKQYANLPNYTLRRIPRSDPSQEKKPSQMEDLSIPETEIEEKNIWN